MGLESMVVTPSWEPRFTQQQQAAISNQLQHLGLPVVENDLNLGLVQLDELLKTSTARLLELSDPNPHYQNWISPDLQFQTAAFSEAGLTGEIIIARNILQPIDPNRLADNDHLFVVLNAMLEGHLSYRSKLMQRLAFTTHLGSETELTDNNSLEARRLQIATYKDRLQLLGEIIANTFYNEADNSYRLKVNWKYNNPIYYIKTQEEVIFPLGRIMCHNRLNKASDSEISDYLIHLAPKGSVLLGGEESEQQGILIPVKDYYVPRHDSEDQAPDYKAAKYPLDEAFLNNGGQKSNSFREETTAIYEKLTLQGLCQRITADQNLADDVVNGDYYYYSSFAASRLLESYHGEIDPQVLSLPLDQVADFFNNPKQYLQQLLSGGIELGFTLQDCFSQHIHLDARWLDQGTTDKYDPLLEIRKREADLSLETKATIWVPVAFLIKDFFRVRPEKP